MTSSKCETMQGHVSNVP